MDGERLKGGRPCDSKRGESKEDRRKGEKEVGRESKERRGGEREARRDGNVKRVMCQGGEGDPRGDREGGRGVDRVSNGEVKGVQGKRGNDTGREGGKGK